MPSAILSNRSYLIGAMAGAIVVAEEHLAAGGLGALVAMVVTRTEPVPMAYVNVGDRYAESGDSAGLLEKYGLTSEAIVNAVVSLKS